MRVKLLNLQYCVREFTVVRYLFPAPRSNVVALGKFLFRKARWSLKFLMESREYVLRFWRSVVVPLKQQR